MSLKTCSELSKEWKIKRTTLHCKLCQFSARYPNELTPQRLVVGVNVVNHFTAKQVQAIARLLKEKPIGRVGRPRKPKKEKS